MRFRHLDGDVGPLMFSESASVGEMKTAIMRNWPEEGVLNAKKPEGEAHLRIMYQGKILPDTQTITDLKRLPGDLQPGKLLTLHLLISPPGQRSGRQANAKAERSEPACCTVQ